MEVASPRNLHQTAFVRGRALAIALLLPGAASLLTGQSPHSNAQSPGQVRRITWDDARPLHTKFEANGIEGSTFSDYVERVHQANQRRVREGDLDHLIFYLLQSTTFTSLPPIEPALSARALVDGLPDASRETFLQTLDAPPPPVPADVRARLAAFLHALDAPGADPRLTIFRTLVDSTFPVRSQREAALAREYARVMRFVYEKEFLAPRSAGAASAIADLYQSRGLSTDTAVEAGYLVYQALGVLKALEPDRRIRRVLIVGPGMDLAPRTDLLEASPPESYQPWAVIDALLALGLSRIDDLQVVGADINPRVVEHLRRVGNAPPTLTVITGIRPTDTLALSQEYLDYFERLGRTIGDDRHVRREADGRLSKRVSVSPSAAGALSAVHLDIVIQRLDGPAFDLVVATNVLPYFGEQELMLALVNIAGMLAPEGVLLHNEARTSMHELTVALGLPFVQSRHAVIASVRGAAAPLFDSVWLHRKTK